MKRFACWLCALTLTIPAALAGNDLGLSASYWDTSDAGSSWGAGLKTGLEMVEGVQFELRASFFNNLSVDGADLDVVPLEAGLALVYPVTDELDLRGGGGVGYYLVDGSGTVGGVRTDPGNEVGFYLVAGGEYTLRRSEAVYGQTEAGLYAEVLYRSVSVDDATVGSGGHLDSADLDGVGANVGLFIRW